MNSAEFPTFDENAAQIAKNGYSVVPVLRNEKCPVVSDWNSYEYHADDLRQYPGAGIGILTKHTPIIDADVRHVQCAAEIESMVRDIVGPAPKRIGQAPKAAYVCQLKGEPFQKIQSRGYRFTGDAPDAKPHKVEILADGQHLVIYNIHPDTRQPYKWNGHGSPLTVAADNLPFLSKEQGHGLVDKAEQIMAKYGTPIASLKTAESERKHVPNESLLADNPAQLRAALAAIRNDDLAYDDWIHIGHAVKGALGETGCNDFLQWSAQATKNDPEVTLAKWATFRPQGIGAGSIFYLAKSHGWKGNARPEQPPDEFYESIAPNSAWSESRDSPPQGDIHTDEWAPPPVTSYGASFDPAKIPLRQWIIHGRYARGEGSALVGPPGTNKSSLMMLDAVQMITGRSLLGERIERTGGVLFLVGEDGRRDFEARLAAICAHYTIAPGELKDRLHVVYQSEIDPLLYTLARLREEMVILDTRMFGWLRQFPDIVALMVDPMLSWHQLIENDNPSMMLLCRALTNLAVQGNIAVTFDHHTTKASMTDSEAHVGNLAAIRGGGAIGGQMRWAFTMAKLKPETAARYGIPDEDRGRYRRLDSLKANYGPDSGEPAILKVEEVRIANGEFVGILTPVDSAVLAEVGKQRKVDAEADWRERFTDALGRALMSESPRSLRAMADWMVQYEPEIFMGAPGKGRVAAPLAADTVRKRLAANIGHGLQWNRAGGSVWIVANVPKSTPTDKGKIKPRDVEIDFAKEPTQ